MSTAVNPLVQGHARLPETIQRALVRAIGPDLMSMLAKERGSLGHAALDELLATERGTGWETRAVPLAAGADLEALVGDPADLAVAHAVVTTGALSLLAPTVRRRVFDCLDEGAQRRAAETAAVALDPADVVDLIEHSPTRARAYGASLWHASVTAQDARALREVLSIGDAVTEPIARALVDGLSIAGVDAGAIIGAAEAGGWAAGLAGEVLRLRSPGRRGVDDDVVLDFLVRSGVRPDGNPLWVDPDLLARRAQRDPFDAVVRLAELTRDDGELAARLFSEALGARRGVVVEALSRWPFTGTSRAIAEDYVDLVLDEADERGADGAALRERLLGGPYEGPWRADQLVRAVGGVDAAALTGEWRTVRWRHLSKILEAEPGERHDVGPDGRYLLADLARVVAPGAWATLEAEIAGGDVPAASVLWDAWVAWVPWGALRERLADPTSAAAIATVLEPYANGPDGDAWAARFVTLESTWRGTLGELVGVLASMDGDDGPSLDDASDRH